MNALRAPSRKCFFDQFPQFYATSQTGPSPVRLNARHRALIASQSSVIRNKTILDLGSHDGRWSFAALKANAKRVVGVEPRSHFVRLSKQTFRSYGLAESRYHFQHSTAEEFLRNLEADAFDTVFCFGLLYHTNCFEEILGHCARVAKRAILVDTLVYGSQDDCVWEGFESQRHPSNGLTPGNRSASKHRIRVPSEPALMRTLRDLNLEVRLFPWRTYRTVDWLELQDYYRGARVSLRAELNKGRRSDRS